MPQLQGFPPIGTADARILILGSMPGNESIRLQQYYAHPRNAFWPILSQLLEAQAPNWASKVQLLEDHGIALWDVLQACSRHGSLDSAIDMSSVITNDFESLFNRHPCITHVFFNGAKAEQLYRRHVLPTLRAEQAGLILARMPSTSPAHASMDLEQKISAWRVILEPLHKVHRMEKQ